MKLDLCPICRSYETTQLYPSDIDLKKLSFTYVKTPDSGKTFRSVRCLNCSHVFCSPIPKNIYKNYEDVVDNQYLSYLESIKISSKIILPYIKRLVPNGKILDVGCATGEFLTVAKKSGYLAEGLELSKWSSEIARKKKIKVYRERLKELAKKYPERYEVITLFGVIEHFEFPIEEISNIYTLLKPGGILVIWTGNVNSISSRILRRNWWYWQGQHIQYFSHKSLNLLAKNSGFEHITTKTYPFVATYDLLDNSLSRYRLRKLIMKLSIPFFKARSTWTFYIPGEMLWLGRKTSGHR